MKKKQKKLLVILIIKIKHICQLLIYIIARRQNIDNLLKIVTKIMLDLPNN